MNLLDKLKKLHISGSVLVLIPFFFACNDPSRLGLELDPDGNNVATEKREFILPATTIYVDSLRTNHYSTSVFGQYEDSIVGKVRVTSYNSFNAGSGTFPGDSLDYTGARLLFRVRSKRAQGLATNERIAIHEAQDTLFSQVVYLSNRVVPYESTPVTEHTFNFNPAVDTFLTVPLSAAYGTRMFNLLRRVSASTTFRDSLLNDRVELPALVLVPGDQNKVLYEFDLNADSAALYIDMVSDSTNRPYHFTFDLNDLHYSHIERDRAGSKLSDLGFDYAESTTPSDLVYLDMMAGVAPKVDLSEVHEFLESNDGMFISGAQLTLVPYTYSSGFISPVRGLHYFFLKNNGRINGAGVDLGQGYRNAILSEISYVPGSSSPSLLVSSYSDSTKMYSSNVTLFVQELYDNYLDEEDYLTTEFLIYGSQVTSIGQTSLPKGAIRLTLFYSYLKD